VNWDNWATVADLATALGTLILAVATFSAVRSANLSAKVAQASLLVGLRPVLMATRREDPTQKVNFGDRVWVPVPGGGAVGEVGSGDGSLGDGDVIYLAIAVRNAGNGIAVLHGWHFYPLWHRDDAHAPLEEFRRQTRDLWVPVGDVGFWQGAFRDTADPQYEVARKAIEARQPWTIELLYGDHEGGQRCITRFTMLPREGFHADPDQSNTDQSNTDQSSAGLSGAPPSAAPDPADAPAAPDSAETQKAGDPAGLGWLASQSRHWNVDRPDPR
jgi:hypothetical protein